MESGSVLIGMSDKRWGCLLAALHTAFPLQKVVIPNSFMVSAQVFFYFIFEIISCAKCHGERKAVRLNGFQPDKP